MRIVIDINAILEGGGGLGNCVRMLVKHLAAIDTENDYLLYLHQWRKPDYSSLARVIPQQPNFRLVWHRVPNVASLFAEYKLGIPLTELLLGGGANTVFHGPGNIVPMSKTMKSVVTLHHYTPTDDPLFSEKLNARTRFFFNMTEKAVRAADHVIAVSENTKKDAIDKIGIPAEKISIVYPGEPRQVYRRIENCMLTPALAEKLKGKYILFLGPHNTRKNLPGFLKAFSAVKDKLGGSQLAITGSMSPAYAQEILRLVETLALGQQVVFLGKVSDEELLLLYNCAQCLVYPSLVEGFGTPPIEAMACGCPVMASNVAAIPEITAGAALLVDPTDTNDMAQTLLRITGDDALRRDLVEKGYKRIKDFSWRRNAQETLAIFKRCRR